MRARARINTPLAASAVLTMLLVVALNDVGLLDVERLRRGIHNAGIFFGEMVPPETGVLPEVSEALIETIQIAFAGTLLAMMLWELAAPRRPLSQDRGARWAKNLGLLFLDTALVRACSPVLAVGLAGRLLEQGLGFFNRAELPPVLEAVLASLHSLNIYLNEHDTDTTASF